MNEKLKEDQIVYCCDGENVGYTEHPRIYLNVKKDEQVDCPYCGKVFTYN